ncbi:MAG: arylamine N-acetyltransferase [Eubacterium sp.]|nr:arylamine N-acetyltransferase [Eubacterium sp.]
MEFLFSGLYEDIPNIDVYLERIDYRGDQRPTLDNLKELIWKHLTHIPYGNLDFYRNRNCPSLAISDIFEKIITNHGCGGCFEINLLFFALLKSIGYNFFPVIVKCLFGSSDPVVPTHCAAIVIIDDKRYYVDVGLGLPSPVVPVELCEDSGWQPAAISPHYYSYKMQRRDNAILLEGYNGSKRMSMVSFIPQSVELVDFIPLNYYASMAKTSPVTQGIIVEMFKEKGIACILKNRLTVSSDDKVEKRLLETEDEFNTAIREIFGIRV